MLQIFLIALLSYQCVGKTLAEIDDDTSSHITGSVRIKRSSLSGPFMQCVFHSAVNNTYHCPHSVGNWSDVHCVNNSFGLYTPQSHFMHLGTGPLGINLNDGYLQYISYIPTGNSHHKDEATTKKIEHLIEEKAKLEMKATFYESRFHELEETNEEMRKQLEKYEEQYQADSLRINSLTIRLNRWEEGTAACKEDIETVQEQTSAALQICNSHIAQLEKENDVFMDTNRELSDTVAKLRNSLSSIRASSNQCNTQLAECKAQLGICEEAERELEISVEQLRQSHQTYVSRAENEYTTIHSQLELVRKEVADCTASLNAARTRNDGLQQSRDEYISRLSQESTLLKQCHDDYSRCHANHSASIDLHEECKDQIDQMSLQVTEMREKYLKCESGLSESKYELQALSNQHAGLVSAQDNSTSHLEQLTHENTMLLQSISELRIMYSTEKAHSTEVKSEYLQCQTDLRVLTEQENALKHALSEAKQTIAELELSKAECIHSKETLAKDMAIILGRLHNTEEKLKVCQNQRDQYQSEHDRLVTMTSSVQGELSALKKTYTILVSQHHDCMTMHNVSIDKIDDWEQQYLNCNNENRNLTTSLMECKTKTDFMLNMLKSLEQEAEVALQTQQNLSDRLKKSTAIISDLTKTIAEGDRKIEDLEHEIARLNEELQRREGSCLTINFRYTECMSNYSLSQQTITELQHSAQFTSELLESMQNQAKETSDQLVDAQADLSHNQLLLQQQINEGMALQTRLTAIQELYENEHRRRIATDTQLQLCRGNHTEAITESQTWALKLTQCQEHTSQLINSHEQAMQEIEERLGAMTVAKESEIEANNQLNATLHQCQMQTETLQSEKGALQHQIGQCAQNLQIYIHQYNHIINLKITLENRLDTCLTESRKCESMLQFQIMKLEQCNERVLASSADLELVRAQLDHCNLQCKHTSVNCPEGPAGETYIITSSGCLMQTSRNGTEEELEQYCQNVKGHLLTLPAMDEHFNRDIFDMLKYSGEKATTIWVSRPDQPEEDCYSVDVPQMESDPTKPVEYIKTSCEQSLPAICFASLHDISLDSSMLDMGGMEHSIDTIITDTNVISTQVDDVNVQVSSSSSSDSDWLSSFLSN